MNPKIKQFTMRTTNDTPGNKDDLAMQLPGGTSFIGTLNEELAREGLVLVKRGQTTTITETSPVTAIFERVLARLSLADMPASIRDYLLRARDEGGQYDVPLADFRLGAGEEEHPEQAAAFYRLLHQLPEGVYIPVFSELLSSSIPGYTPTHQPMLYYYTRTGRTGEMEFRMLPSANTQEFLAIREDNPRIQSPETLLEELGFTPIRRLEGFNDCSFSGPLEGALLSKYAEIDQSRQRAERETANRRIPLAL